MELLEVVNGSQVRTKTLDAARITIGRGDGNDVIVDGDAAVSREHARLEKSGGSWQIIDLRSSNGTFVNGEPITAPTIVELGDQIRIGNANLKLTTDLTATSVIAMESARHSIEKGRTRITVRQRRILGLLAQGLTDHEIAGRLKLKPEQVTAELNLLSANTGVHGRKDLARLALQVGAN